MFKERIKKLYLYRWTLWDMALRQLKLKYAGSKLGIWWAIVIPLILALSINFIFTTAFKVTTPNYTLFILAGIIPWFFFTNALTETTDSFLVNAPVLKQSLLPPEFVPIANILANLLNFLIGLLFLLPLFIVLNFKVIRLLPLLFLVIILHFLFVVGLGFLFSITNVFFRDLSHFLSIAFMVWFWITPIFYSLDTLPFPLRWLCLFNPMSYYIILYQNILFEAKIPSFSTMMFSLILAMISLIGGSIFFIKKESMLLKRI